MFFKNSDTKINYVGTIKEFDFSFRSNKIIIVVVVIITCKLIKIYSKIDNESGFIFNTFNKIFGFEIHTFVHVFYGRSLESILYPLRYLR